jgi:two-component sensor histidine kinase
VRDDWDLLVGILDKALKSIPIETRNSISQKWIAVRYEYGINPTTVLRRYVLIGSLSLLLLAVFLFWIIRLRYEIKTRKLTEESLSESEANLRETVTEKETLMKEINHRVKNNLALISSLIKLQSDELNDKIMLEQYRLLESRIGSISLLHEMLYKSDSLKQISVKHYIEELIIRLEELHEDSLARVSIESEFVDASFKSATIIPLGLIITELITNALKHAFPEEAEGKISLKLIHHEEKYILTVSDDGKSISKDFKPAESDSLGLRLVDLLTEQLNGQLELNRDHGTEFRISWPK